MALTIVTWLWGQKYPPEYLVKLVNGLRRHLEQPYRLICQTDDLKRSPVKGVEYRCIWDRSLLRVPGCFARLRMFDSEWQRHHEIEPDERIVSIDLDVVITGPLDPLFDRVASFLVLQGANAVNPCPYNGSLWMLRAGYRPDIWSDFSLEAAARMHYHEFPDDQGWFWHKLSNAAGWQVPDAGIYSFRKPHWPRDDVLPAGARMVVFPGWRSPDKFRQINWIRQHWQ